ncbi:hypothetical protein [Brevundimonas lutea]|uniref:hypothetical protein n=1 Tax=Brevundimonas lutea TaxID=2293980 RepID=UPI000F03AECE|nr:hypothetical protein [Brevundimonas lutea]
MSTFLLTAIALMISGPPWIYHSEDSQPPITYVEAAQIAPAENFGSTYANAGAALAEVAQQYLGGVGPTVTLAVVQDMTFDSAVVTFHHVWRSEGDQRRRVWLARWAEIAPGDEDGGFAIRIRYTDIDTCPAMLDVLKAIEAVPHPSIDLAGVPDLAEPLPVPTQLRGIVIDGWKARLETSSVYFGDRWARLAIESASDGPVAQLAVEAEETMRGCWSDVEPN